MKKLIVVAMLVFCFLIMSPINPKDITYAKDEVSNVKAVYLMDVGSGQVLMEQNSEVKLPVASIVKLMTVLITFEKIDEGKISLDDKVVASSTASGMGGSQVFIETGGEYTVDQLLKSVIVCSANDASVALAEYIAGSENQFVELMNKRAKELGLDNTVYYNCTGLPAAGQFSCAKDMARLLAEVIKHEKYFDYSTIWIDKLEHSAGRVTELVNTNKLIRYFNGCDGGKTGSTNEAGYCLVATAKRGDMRLIGAVLGCESGKDRFSKTSDVLNFGFNNFTNKKVISKDDVLDNNISVMGGKDTKISVSPNKDIYYLQNRSSDDDVEIKYELPEYIKAPIKVGDVVGKVYAVVNGVVVGECYVVSCVDVLKSTYFDALGKIAKDWSIK